MNLWGGNMPSEPSHLNQQSPLHTAGQGRGGLSHFRKVRKRRGRGFSGRGAWVGA